MESNVTLDQASPADGPRPGVETNVEPQWEGAVQQGSATRTSQASISAALAAAGAGTHPAIVSSLRFPGEDGGHSLAEMAQRDLDAALQLLADRAQYITGAAGAAIALRRSGRSDMLCRASSGRNAPELGALLSTEFGLSGECVRTRQPLRCDDAERDARVNRDACREMGIASVAVMPVLQENDVLGVFELFSGKANAFGERDLSALERLSQMVEIAVRLAHVAEALPERLLAVEPLPEVAAAEATPADEPVLEVESEAVAIEAAPELPAAIAAQDRPASPLQAESPLPAPKPALPQQPLFWSAPINTSADAQQSEPPDQSNVPPVLRNLRQCEACGFPVSAGRTLCVECEEKKWRGQLKAASEATPRPVSGSPTDSAPAIRAFAAAAQSSAAPLLGQQRRSAGTVATAAQRVSSPAKETGSPPAARQPLAPEAASETVPETSQAQQPEFVFSAGLEPAQSWFAANKYILAAILVVAAVVGAIFLLR